ncbi:type III pantothenate kinase [Taibaiella lutea]|uniref:Type III pantothenate kinase n=1 Tax=Taibaiella lutea TaxID=2608001 RepID=A0A5M6CJX7_9BACT|nr:type III pantothenate kinase [Taibaiella lutea]KAA5534740.1 type III pantothenate kinase [Taibaiella lutea]
MRLCIDWGNSRIKAAIFQDEKIVKDYNFSEDEALTGIVGLMETHKPKAVILSAVANYPPELKMLLQDHAKLIILNSNTSLPIMNAYHSPDTLGADRLALAVAANHLFPQYDNLVISLGTAITYNFLPKNRAFRGGNITPGMEMRFKALHEFTDKLPLVAQQGDLVLLGYDTETSIRSGVMMGIAAEIDGMINFYKEQYPTLNVTLTGGNAPLFADKIKNQIAHDSQLLLKGLDVILRHNVR